MFFETDENYYKVFFFFKRRGLYLRILLNILTYDERIQWLHKTPNKTLEKQRCTK